MSDKPVLVELPAAPRPPISERHVQALAAALHAEWGPCDTDNQDDCDGKTCHVTLVRTVLERSAAMPVSVPLDTLAAAHDAAWRVACCYGDLIPEEAKQHLPGGPHMALNKAHVGTVVARIASILRGEAGR